MNAVAVFVVALTVVVFAYVRSYNRLVNDREVLDDAWATLAAELDRRHELVTRLVEAVTVSPVDEPRLIDDLLSKLRAAEAAGPEPADRVEPEHELALAAAAVVGLRTQYPVLDGRRSFNDVRRELAVNDDRVSEAVRFHDECVAELAHRMRTFPSNLVARRHGIAPPAPFG